jgi:VWFA-related protein
MHGQTGPSGPQASSGAASVPNGPQPQPTSGIATIHARSNLVVVDVVVTDSKKDPVHGLKASDFTLTEDGKPQAIRNFEEHTAVSLSEIKVAPAPKMPPGLFSNRADALVNGPVNVLLLDYLNTPLTSQASAKRQLFDYLDKAPAGTRIAIFGLTTHLVMLQGFTSDMTKLKATLMSKKGASPVSDIMTDAVNGGVQGNTAFEDAAGPVSDTITQEMLDDMARVDAQLTSEELNNRAMYTLSAFDQLARYLVGIPGRKNVIWFSGSFPLDVLPNLNERDENDSVIRNDDAVRKTDNMLTRAQVAMYPVDARGLQTDPSNSVVNETIADGPMTFMQQTAQEHETMDAMAEDTGGAAFYNTNGLTQAVSKAIEQGSNYYTLTYTPANLQWDARFRTIKVKVDDPNAKQLTYRNGYYAIDPYDRNKVNAQSAATMSLQTNTMASAMMFGGPNPAEILFKARVRPSSAPPDAAVLKTNQSNPDPKLKGMLGGPFKQYGVDLVPDPRAVTCRLGADGNHHCALEMWTFVYDRNGDKLITASNRLHQLLTPAEYARLQSGELAFHQQISVPVKGQYWLRTAIHDMVSDNVGTVEIPVGVVAQLDPLQQVAAAPAPAPDAAGKPAVPATQAPVPAGGVVTP